MRINVAYAVPPKSIKSTTWHDGFTAAIDVIAQEHEVNWLNFHPDYTDLQKSHNQVLDCDFLLIKSNWNWIVTEALRDVIRKDRSTKKGIMISGTAKPPRGSALNRYNVLFYETPWYEPQLKRHPLRVQAFGVDTDVMRPDSRVERDIDWLSVGKIVGYKRHEKLIGLPGRRVVAGDIIDADPNILGALQADGIEIAGFQSYTDLAKLYQRSKNVLINCKIQGGGERAVLEARACFSTVHIAKDNPKLAGLVKSDVWDHHYYAAQLLKGIIASRNSNHETAHKSLFKTLLRF